MEVEKVEEETKEDVASHPPVPAMVIQERPGFLVDEESAAKEADPLVDTVGNSALTLPATEEKLLVDGGPEPAQVATIATSVPLVVIAEVELDEVDVTPKATASAFDEQPVGKGIELGIPEQLPTEPLIVTPVQ